MIGKSQVLSCFRAQTHGPILEWTRLAEATQSCGVSDV